MEGKGVGEEQKSYDRKKAWSSINHARLSVYLDKCSILFGKNIRRYYSRKRYR
jgi:hypothetical protein